MQTKFDLCSTTRQMHQKKKEKKFTAIIKSRFLKRCRTDAPVHFLSYQSGRYPSHRF